VQASRVLLIRLDGIGDALVCTPLVAALRAAGHELGIALSDRNAGIFAPDTARATYVLERIPWPKHGSTPASRERAAAAIAAAGYDVALIASEEPEAYELAAPVPQRVGFTTGWAKPFKSAWVRRRVTTAVRRAATVRGAEAHEAEILFRLGRGLVVPPPERDAARLRRWIVGDSPPPERRGVLVQLGAKWNALGLAAATLTRAMDALRARGARFIAAPAERAAAAAAFPALAVEAPATTRAWIAAVDAAAALISPDTGAAHLGGMLGVPVVDVFPDAHFDAQARRWRPWASSSIVLRASELARAPATLIVQALDGL
jgi:ADP-heptose:LPS heptosyltransferase